MERAPREFAPRVDRWIVWVFFASVAIAVIAMVALWREGEWGWAIFSLVMVLGPALLIDALAWPVRYVVDDDGILVRAGRRRLVVPWAELTSAELVWSPLGSSTAWSLYRVRVVSTRLALLDLAPRDREGFLRELVERSPEHELRDGKVVCRG